jgi:arylsulfatase
MAAKKDKSGNQKPNILVIWGDDIGIQNLSCYSHGVMRYQTPNIDRLAKEGMLFTDSYGEQSCTAGRASFITGQSGFRTGLTKVGVPGATVGLKAEDATIAELLKPQGYATGQFGKNHLGDRNEYLPTVHGFDEFFGNLYHLNAEEEPELPDWPSKKDFPKFNEQFAPRGVLHCWATDKDDPTVDARYGRVGKQKVKDTGPLTKKRMETCDDEFVAAAKDWIKRQHEEDKPWFCWLNTTHMHLRTHTKPSSLGQAGRWQSPYHETMVDHDKNVGEMLDLLDDLGIAEDTFVMYSTDNGPHMNTWPDGAMTPFRSEKDTNWEGAFRVPLLVRWPNKIPARSVSNEIVQHHDWLPTFLAMAGEPEIIEKCKKGYTAGGKTFKIHIDGYNLVPYLTGKEKQAHGRASSTSTMTVTLLPCASTIGRSFLWSSDARGRCASGPSPLLLFESQSSETFAPILSSEQTLPRIPILQLVPESRFHRLGGHRHRVAVPGNFQGVSATTAGCFIHDRSGD